MPAGTLLSRLRGKAVGNPRAGDGKWLSEKQALAIELAAWQAETNVAEQRRLAVTEYADRLLADPDIAHAVTLMLRARAEAGYGTLRIIRTNQQEDAQ